MNRQTHSSFTRRCTAGLSALVILGLVVLSNKFSTPPVYAVGDFYVDINATVAGCGAPLDGSSWACAFNDINSAIAAASSGQQIWVADGTYTPGTARANSFALKDGVEIYGGFTGWNGGATPGSEETLITQRDSDPSTNNTILSGDIGTPSDTSDNTYHVVTSSSASAATILDGFTIRDGNANINSGTDDLGGGMYNSGGSPTLRNLLFTSNNSTDDGGGMYNNASSPILSDVVFFSNSATANGGAMYNNASSPIMDRVTFRSNTANIGAGMYNTSSNAVLTNVALIGNIAGTWGGGLYNNNNSNLTLTNVTIVNNQATSGSSLGGGMRNVNSDPLIQNSILWGNTATTGPQIQNSTSSSTPTLRYTIIEGTLPNFSVDGGNNLFDVDPLLLDAANGDVRLDSASPAINAGDNSADTDANTAGTQAIPTLDLANNTRIAETTVDLGAYERQRIYVDITATTGANDGSSWADAYTNLQSALSDVKASSGVDIWVADGTYTPGSARGDTFNLADGGAVYGGFTGWSGGGGADETLLSQRDSDPASNNTILSGEIGAAGTADNSYHVVSSDGLGSGTVLDGFTITAGNADGGGTDNLGGGMYGSNSTPTLRNLLFDSNSAVDGGGLYNDSSNTELVEVVFRSNTATSGAGMYNNASSPGLVNTSFVANAATDGGGMYNAVSSTPTLTNTVFSGNDATGNGGGIYNSDSTPLLTNVTLSGNDATSGGAIYSTGSSSTPRIQNSILWGNTVDQLVNAGGATTNLDFSLLEDAALPSGTSGSNNIFNTDPLFVTDVSGAVPTTSGNLRLQAESPAINAGSDSLVPADTLDADDDSDTSETLPIDRIGSPRLVGTVDMGAYEWRSLYVDQNATGTDDGSSWANAFTDLQSALAIASAGDEIWVANGTYTPGSSRTDTFTLVDGVAVYGGFTGDSTNPDGGTDETLRSQRTSDPTSNNTVLSGEIGAAGSADNSYHVVRGDALGSTAILDGFTIRDGNGDAASTNDRGGGLYLTSSNPTLSNLRFSSNNATLGGGLFNDNSDPTLTSITFTGNTATSGAGMYSTNTSDPVLDTVTFTGNTATSNGGGMFNDGGSASLRNITFDGNSATSGDGGGMYNQGSASPLLFNSFFVGNSATDGGGMYNDTSTPTLGNLVFSGNTATSGSGGGIYNTGSTPDIRNTTLSNNTASSGSGGGMFSTGGTPTVRNAVFWGNSASSDTQISGAADVENSTVESGFTGSGNISTDPQFFDADGADNTIGTTDDDVRLRRDSTAINAGSDAAVPTDALDLDDDTNTAEPLPLDLAGNARFVGTVDMGAYEARAIYVDQDATVAGCGAALDGTSWACAYTDLQDALTDATNGLGDLIWVADGTYTPGTTRSDSFTLVDSVAVYGGFTGWSGGASGGSDETLLSQRNSDPASNNTTLSGEIGVAGTADNSYHVVRSSGVGATTILDGFSITAGNANGTAPDNGGGGMLNESSSTPTLNNLLFTGNSATFGGGMRNVSSDPVLDTVTFTSNTAPGNSSAGGGMRNDNSSPTLTNVAFTSNTAPDTGATGGGMSNSGGSPTLDNVTFTSNTANGVNAQGGGMHNDGSTPTLTSVTFTSNEATNGGGMFNDNSSDAGLLNVTFDDNQATNGGGMYNLDSTPTVINVGFYGNDAVSNGGGMFNGTSGNPNLSNTVFSGNTADIGAGMYNDTNAPVLTNVTFANNAATSNGGGMRNTTSNPQIRNSIFFGNTAGTLGPHIQNGSSTPIISNSLFEGTLPTGSTDNGGNIFSSDPLFVDADGADNVVGTTDDDLSLSGGSPAINVGDDSFLPADTLDMDSDSNTTETLPLDLNNNSRSVASVDMGAYEVTGIFVDEDATVAGCGATLDGTSWACAYNTLQDALADPATSSGAVILVADGIYSPGGAAGDTFQLENGVAIYGGFGGWSGGASGGDDSTLLDDRDFTATPSILSGGNVNNHVVTGSGTDSTALLDGFTISDGNANGGGSDNNGAGMRNDAGSPMLNNLVFTSNTATASGGGLSNENGSNPAMTNIEFTGNIAVSGGGMINFNNSDPTISNATFQGNNATNGAGMYNGTNSDPTVYNVTFSGNTASNNGGGMFNTGTSNPTVYNATFSGNTASNGGGMRNESSNPLVRNTIFWGNTGGEISDLSSNPDVGFSIVEGGYTDPTNIDADPLLGSLADNGGSTQTFALLPGSAAINAGSSSICNDTATVNNQDQRGEPRPTTTCDIGAYQTTVVNTTADTIADNGVCSLREAIIAANTNTASGSTAGECAAGSTAGTQDPISFAIGGAGTLTIAPTSALPDITESVSIDGTTQSSATCTNGVPGLRIALSGSSAGAGVTGLSMTTGDYAVTGLSIHSFGGNGLALSSSGSGTVECNQIGETPSGTVAANGGNGVNISAGDVTVKGNNIVNNSGRGLNISAGTTLAYANNVYNNSAGQALCGGTTNLRYNFWGNGFTTGGVGTISGCGTDYNYRLGAPIEQWSEADSGNTTLGSAELQRGSGTGRGVIINHGQGTNANVPFRLVDPGMSYGLNPCADYYDFFVVNAGVAPSGTDWGIRVPLDTTSCTDSLFKFDPFADPTPYDFSDVCNVDGEYICYWDKQANPPDPDAVHPPASSGISPVTVDTAYLEQTNLSFDRLASSNAGLGAYAAGEEAPSLDPTAVTLVALTAASGDGMPAWALLVLGFVLMLVAVLTVGWIGISRQRRHG